MFLKNLFNRIRKNKNISITYYYTIDEAEFEHDPLKIRTLEISEFQDEARDIESRCTERDVFDEKVSECNGRIWSTSA